MMTVKQAFRMIGLWILGVVVGILLIVGGSHVPANNAIDSHQAFGTWVQYAGIAFLLVVIASFCDSIRCVCQTIRDWWNAPIVTTPTVNPRLRALAAKPSRLDLLARNAQLMAERRAQEEKRRELLRTLGVNIPED